MRTDQIEDAEPTCRWIMGKLYSAALGTAAAVALANYSGAVNWYNAPTMAKELAAHSRPSHMKKQLLHLGDSIALERKNDGIHAYIIKNDLLQLDPNRPRKEIIDYTYGNNTPGTIDEVIYTQGNKEELVKFEQLPAKEQFNIRKEYGRILSRFQQYDKTGR